MTASQTEAIPKAMVRGWRSALRQIGGRDDQVDGTIRTVSVAFLANLVVAIAKYIGFFLSGSSAVLAESLHSTAVTVNQGLMMHGRLRSERPETTKHPFGFGPERYFWAFVVPIMMFGIGAVVSIGRGVLALGGQIEGMINPIIPLAALTVGLLMDGWSFLVAAHQTRQDKGDLSYRQYVERSRDPEIPVVLLEDSAAMVGLLFAYLGVGLTVLTGNHVYDAIASLLIGLLLAVVAFILAREMKSLVIGESALPEKRREIESAITDHPRVREVVHVRSLHLGPEDLLVEAKVGLQRDLRYEEVAGVIDEIERDVRSRVPLTRIVAIEPDVPDGHDSDSSDNERRDGGGEDVS